MPIQEEKAIITQKAKIVAAFCKMNLSKNHFKDDQRRYQR